MQIDEAILQSIIDHCSREMPHEACGYLAAEHEIITRHYELTNIDRAADHFSMDTEEQFAAINDMRSRNLKLAAVYHSHPETPARPSEEDIRLAYDPQISYVIISLVDPEITIKSFKIHQQKDVTPEDIEIIRP